MFWIALLGFLLPQSTVAFTRKPACIVMKSSGDIRYRSALSVNWRKLGKQKQLYAGDVIFTRPGASAQLEYIYAGGSVQLPEQTLFHINENLPTYTKLRRRFGIEKVASSSVANSTKKKDSALSTLFERKSVRHQDSPQKLFNSSHESMGLSMNRESSPIKLATPIADSRVLTDKFPSSLAIKVDQEFMGQKYFAYLWRAEDPFQPIWTGFAQGEFANVSVPSAGSYQLQVISEDESMSSEPIAIHYLDQQAKLAAAIESLHDKRKGNHLILVE